MASHRKGAQGRDYAAEYAARKSQGLSRALSLTQVRGHPRRSETALSALKKLGFVGGPSGQDRSLQAYYRVVKRLAKGESLTTAARAEGTTPRTVKRLNEERVLFHFNYRKTKRGNEVFRGFGVVTWSRFPILTADGILHPSVPLDKKNASLMGEYWNAEQAALEGKDDALKRFAGTVIYNLDGTPYRLLTDVNAIRRFWDSLSDADAADFNRTFYRGREVLYVA